MSMENWNLFVKETLAKQQDKPDKGDKGNFFEDLIDTKKAVKRGGFIERN